MRLFLSAFMSAVIYRSTETVSKDDVAAGGGSRKTKATNRPSYLLFDHREALHLQVGGLQGSPGLDEAGLHRLQVAAQLLLPQRHGQQLVDLLALCANAGKQNHPSRLDREMTENEE